MAEELFKPSLKNNNYVESKTYDISKLFYVAFFGGIIPTVILGTKNAKWLKINKKIINFMIILGVLVLFSKFIVAGLVFIGYFELSSRTVRIIYRIGSLLIYLGYFFITRDKLKQHMIIGGSYQPMLKDAIKWTIIGIVIEFIISLLVGIIVKNVF